MCAAKTTRDSPLRSGHSPGRASELRSKGLDTTGPDPPIEATSPRITMENIGLFPEGNRIEEKIRASIDLDFWPAASCGDFFEARGNGLGHSVQALRDRCCFALRRHR